MDWTALLTVPNVVVLCAVVVGGVCLILALCTATGRDALAQAGVRLGLAGYALTETFHMPAVLVYPARELAEDNQEAATRIAALRQLLADKPANPTNELPFLPLFNAAQHMRVGVKYVSFPNGHGMRNRRSMPRALSRSTTTGCSTPSRG